ncbi:MAG: hypothetical protein KDD94_13955, partial [Calditrichaeota bacterium]|nr:hypothetical protein [Calditrichota bacterium]
MQKKFVYSLICFLVLFLLITILKLSNPFGLLFLSGLNVFVLTLTPLLILTAYHLSRKANWLRFITFFPALIGLLLISLQFIIWVDYRYLIPNTRIKPLNEAEFKTDNDTLIKQLINHPKIDSIQELINDTDLKQIQEYDPNPNRQMVRMMQAISSLNDGHSFMHPFQLYPDSRFFPLNGYYFDDGYYITRTASAYDQIQNYRLIAINGISFDSIFTRMKTVIGADNLSYQKSMLDIYLFSANVLNGLGIIDSVDEAIFLLVDADGFKHDLHINSVAMPFWLFWTLKPTDESSPVNPAPRKKKYELHTSNSDLFLIF